MSSYTGLPPFRVTITPGSLVGAPATARKRRRCDGHMADAHWIEVGDRFIYTALPPDHPDIGNPGWWHARYCSECWPENIVDLLATPEGSESGGGAA